MAMTIRGGAAGPRRMHNRSRSPSRLVWLALLTIACPFAAVWAQQAIEPPTIAPATDDSAKAHDAPVDENKLEPFPVPDLHEAVSHLLDQDYLTQDEKRALRVKHGLAEESDLADVATRARAALLRGAWLDASLFDVHAEVLDRAEAAQRRGEAAEALSMLGATPAAHGARGLRIAAEALIDSGQLEEALAMIEPLAAGADGPLSSVTDADELVERVRCVTIVTRLRGQKERGTREYQSLLDSLGRARDDLDRLSWSAPLAEAWLLYEKDRYSDAVKALEQSLTLNGSLAEAWHLLGQISVDGFDFDRARSVAARLDELAKPDVSPLAAQVRAAVLIRQNEGAAAEAELAPALVRLPANRLLMATNAAAAATRFDFTLAQQRLDAFEALAPKSPMAYLIAGRAMAGSRQYEEAAGYLRTAAERAPTWAEPMIELGLSELQAGRNGPAYNALEKATKLDPLNIRAANSLEILKQLETFASVESDHFIVRYRPGIDEILATEMLPVLERIFTRVTGNGPGGIDHKPAHKTVVELYPNHRSFGVRITGMPQLHTIAAATGPVIAMEVPRIGPGHYGAYNWARVVQHEYTHTVTLSRTKNRLPHWFTEASAVYLEDAPRDYGTVQLLTGALLNNALFDLDTINIMFVRPRRPSDRSLAYAQGAWMYQYMIEQLGTNVPLDLMDLYATGEREQAAFQSVMGISREQFLSQFKVWARTQLESWGMAPSAEHPSIADLLKADAPAEADGEAQDQPRTARNAGPTEAQVDAWLAKYPANPFVLALKVEMVTQAQGGNATAESVELLERYAAARPVDPLPHRLLAAYYLGTTAPEQAVPHLEWLDIRESYAPGYAVELARRYQAMGQMDKALEKAERATQISPYDARFRELAATIALRNSDLESAERHIRALTRLEPDRPEHQRRLEAIIARRKG